MSDVIDACSVPYGRPLLLFFLPSLTMGAQEVSIKKATLPTITQNGDKKCLWIKGTLTEIPFYGGL